MDQSQFREALLQQMERKTHWAWSLFTDGRVARDRLHVHLEQEYEVYVRDFPVIVARAYVQCPVAAVRRELAENIFEEETGGLVAGRPHPELFLEYPRGLGMDLRRFDDITLLPESARYRAFLDEATQRRGWPVAAALSVLFLEGTAYERGELDAGAPRRPEPRWSEHPLVKHYGLSEAHLALTKAHRQVEGDHRKAAWRVMLDHIPAADREDVVDSLREAVALWRLYRDGVAYACGLSEDMTEAKLG